MVSTPPQSVKFLPTHHLRHIRPTKSTRKTGPGNDEFPNDE
jgi:hypothetical protein